jgi:diadenylate cyclase
VDAFIDYVRRVAMYPWWVVFIELFFICFVVYWAVDFLEGTRGERLFRGVLLIIIGGFLILKLIVGQFPFERLQYLFNWFLVAVIIITVAGFQPEIRRALIRIGQPRFLAGTPQQRAKTIEQTIAAVTQLAAARIGAIIVVENRVALGEFIETGVRMDARVTQELLQTIFHPGTALHDMAVIIRADRLVAARVQLPLAEAGSVDGVEFGSRHRAAIGITSGSDATCIVVSEQTGAISFAHNGNLTRRVTETQLRKHLTCTLSEAATPTLAGTLERLWRFSEKKTKKKQGPGPSESS